jgi:hypothetical protein
MGCGGSAGINFVKALRLAKKKIYIVGVERNKYYLEMSPVDKRYIVQRKNNKEYVAKLQQI